MKHKVPLVKLIAVKLQHHTEIMRPTAIFHLKNIARCCYNYFTLYPTIPAYPPVMSPAMMITHTTEQYLLAITNYSRKA